MAKLINKDYLTRQFYLYNEEYLKPKVEELEEIKNNIQTDISGLAIKSFSQTNNTGSGEKNTITETLVNGKTYDFYVYNGQGITEANFSSADKNTTGRKKYTLTIKSSNEKTLPTINQDFYDGVGINSMSFTTTTGKRNKYTLTIKSTDEEAVKTISQDFYDGIGIYDHGDSTVSVDGITTHTYKIDYTDGTSDSIVLSDPTSYVKTSISSINTTLGTKVNTSDIVDNLTSTNTDKPLSANQGKVLSTSISSINTTLGTKQNALTVSNPLVLSKDTLSLSLDANTLGINSSNQLYVITATDTEIETEFDNAAES